MTYYKIYLVPKKQGPTTLEPSLYAITDSKKLAKKFMEQRNEEVFRCIKTVTEHDEYAVFYHRLPMLVLKEIPIRTKDENSVIDYSVTKIVGTRREEDELEKFIDDFAFIYEKYLMVPYTQFKESYQNALKILQYDLLQGWALRQRGVPFSIQKIHKIVFDELTLFYYKFGGTFRDPG